MPQSCSVCTHPQLAEIAAALTAGESNRRIASQFGMSEAAVRRHRSHNQSDQGVAPANKPIADTPAPTPSLLEQRLAAFAEALRALESCDAESIEQHYFAATMPLRLLVAEMIDSSLERCRQRDEPHVSDWDRPSFRFKYGGNRQSEWRKMLAEAISR